MVTKVGIDQAKVAGHRAKIVSSHDAIPSKGNREMAPGNAAPRGSGADDFHQWLKQTVGSVSAQVDWLQQQVTAAVADLGMASTALGAAEQNVKDELNKLLALVESTGGSGAGSTPPAPAAAVSAQQNAIG